LDPRSRSFFIVIGESILANNKQFDSIYPGYYHSAFLQMFLVLRSTSDYKAEAFGVPLWLTSAEGMTDTPTNTKEHNDSAVLTTIFESDRYLHPGLWCLYYIMLY